MEIDLRIKLQNLKKCSVPLYIIEAFYTARM